MAMLVYQRVYVIKDHGHLDLVIYIYIYILTNIYIYTLKITDIINIMEYVVI